MSATRKMGDPQDSSPVLVFEKDPLELTVEDVYDISYVIGKDLLKISRGGQEVSELQFKIVRVLEMFEIMVNKYNLSLEELRMERDNLKGEVDRVVAEGSSGRANSVSLVNTVLTPMVPDTQTNVKNWPNCTIVYCLIISCFNDHLKLSSFLPYCNLCKYLFVRITVLCVSCVLNVMNVETQLDLNGFSL